MSAPGAPSEALLDLLIQRATVGLDASEAAELRRRLQEEPGHDEEAMDASVAALQLLLDADPAPMPAALAARILERLPAAPSAAQGVAPARRQRARPLWLESLVGWSAGAFLLLAVAGWWPRLFGPHADRPDVPTRAALLASGRAIEAAWTPGPAAAGQVLSGDVVFDPQTQRGYLLFRGIPANDPRLAQYQLWIADAGRSRPEPVDGGVFDVPPTPGTPTGEVLIPFVAKLRVGRPAAFVVTVEAPGGVVVSRQEQVLALARVP